MFISDMMSQILLFSMQILNKRFCSPIRAPAGSQLWHIINRFILSMGNQAKQSSWSSAINSILYARAVPDQHQEPASQPELGKLLIIYKTALMTVHSWQVMYFLVASLQQSLPKMYCNSLNLLETSTKHFILCQNTLTSSIIFINFSSPKPQQT